MMTFKERLLGVLIGLSVALIAIPVALLLTLLLIPFWSWLEATTGYESIGHSGPAGWCVLVVYFVIVTIGGVIWSRLEKRKRNRAAESDEYD